MMETAIKKAIEGGWIPKYPPRIWSNGVAEIRAGMWANLRMKFFRKNGTVGTKYWHVADTYEVLLDPTFWQCLGKALGWVEYKSHVFGYPEIGQKKIETWKTQWHRFIDHLAEGKDPELFFANLLK